MVPVPGVGGMLLNNIHVENLVSLKFKKVVRQAYDLSCGAAAVATLLKYYWNEDDVTEKGIIESMVEIGDQEKIQKFGFSLLEMKRFVEKAGYVSRGFRLKNADTLARLKVPVISLISVRGYAHFVVIKSVKNGHVFIADPAFGNRVVPLQSFYDEWNKVILVVLSDSRRARNEFSLEQKMRINNADVVPLLNQTLRTVVVPTAGEF